ncbi:MAG: hypothetical protein J6Y65_02565 [Eggerthellaceae bacterium]|nr:hypothetical protein [Eggerthellaceae bacterium]
MVTQNDRLVITVATPYVVPRLLGLLLEPALYAISEAGYVSEVEYREDANHSPGTVFECNYAEGAEVISGSVVHIVIAVAPTPVEPIEDEQTPNE